LQSPEPAVSEKLDELRMERPTTLSEMVY